MQETIMVTEVRHDDAEIEAAEFRYKIIGPGMMTHNYLCAVCRMNKAVIETHRGWLQPCWACQKMGYKLVLKTWLDRLVDRFRNL
jgi:hypothetical protein